MKVKEILEIENANTGSINLFKKGICWRVYEKSAWRFLKNIREYDDYVYNLFALNIF